MAKTPIQALITRPEEDAATLADALRQRGVEVSIEPLLSIRTLPGVAIDLEGVQALLFTSSNGVRAFAELSQRRDLPCFTVGDATAAAARSAGFAQVESAGGDVRDLARLATEKLQPAGGLLFHAAGSAVAGDLAAAIEGAGFGLRRAVLYEAKPAERLADETLRRLTDGAIDWVLFFSPRTAQTFVKLIEAAPVAERLRLAGGIARTEALCLSPAVADAVQKLAWRSVLSALRPDLPGMLQLVDATLAESAPAPVKAPSPTLPVTPPVLPTPPQAPVAPPPPQVLPPQVPPQGGLGVAATGAVAAVVALVVALVVVLSQDLWHASPSRPGPADAALTQRLDAVDRNLAETGSAIATLRQQLGERPAATAAAPLPPEIVGLPERVGALQQQVEKLAAQPPATSPPGPAAAELPAAIAALPERVGALQQQIEKLAAQPAATPAPAATELPAAIAALPDRLAALDQKLQELAANPAGQAALDKLQQEGASLRSDLAAAQSELASLKAVADKLPALDQAIAGLRRQADERGGLLLAIGQLATALDQSRPFAPQLAVLRRLAAGQPAVAAALGPSLDALAPSAEHGIATLADLKASFPAMAAAVVARANGSPNQGSLGARLLGRVEQLVTVRPVGGEVAGDDPPARLARAEAKLEKDDLAGAIAEVGAITGAAAAPAADWLAAARARLAAQQAIQQLQAAAVAVPAAPPAATQPRRRRRRRRATRRQGG
jgi:uroporphyrinogen-III synthase